MRSLLPLFAVLAACHAVPEADAPPVAEQPAVETSTSELRLDALVFERTTRYSSVAATNDAWVVEARLEGCLDFAELKDATQRADMRFELHSDRGEVVPLRGGTGGHSGDWGSGFEAYLVLHPRDRDWAPRLGDTYRLVPRNRTGELGWTVAESATLRL